MQEERGGGEVLSDDEVLATLARVFLEGGATERTKAPYQIAISLCDRCGAGCQESGGRKYALSRADTERACCDAQWIGSLAAAAPNRALQDVSPSTRRLVHRRARGRCEVPGCRSTRCLEIHHIIPRALGGRHDPEGLILLCDGCHAAHHRGLISITGTASELVVTRKHEIAYDMIANDEVADTSSRMASAHVSTNVDCDHDVHASYAEANAHVSTTGSHGPSTVPIDRTGSAHGGPSAHVSTNGSHAPSREPSDRADGPAHAGPSAHVSTNESHDPSKNNDRVIRASAHVSTNDSHDPLKVVDSTAHVSTKVGGDHASAHVSTKESHCRSTDPCDRTGAAFAGPSAHVSRSEHRNRPVTSERGNSARLDASAHVSTNKNHDQPEKGDRAGSSATIGSTAHTSNASEQGARLPAGSSVPKQLSQFERERLRSQSRMALVTLGYRAWEAGKAVDLAIRNGHDTLETVIREALRSCARSS